MCFQETLRRSLSSATQPEPATTKRDTWYCSECLFLCLDPANLLLVFQTSTVGNYKLRTGNIFNDVKNVETIVVPVNCTGKPDNAAVWQCRLNYPSSYAVYSAACREKKIFVGSIIACEESGVRVLFLPIRYYPRNPVKRDDLIKGLDVLIRGCNARQIRSVSMPIHSSRPLFSACTEAAKRMDRTNVFFYREAQVVKPATGLGFSKPRPRKQPCQPQT